MSHGCKSPWTPFTRRRFSRPRDDRSGGESRTRWASGGENRHAFNEDKRTRLAGGIYRSWDQSGLGEATTAGVSADDYTPLSQLRSRTWARHWERHRDRWEQRWDTKTRIQRGRARKIISHCTPCWRMAAGFHTARRWRRELTLRASEDSQMLI